MAMMVLIALLSHQPSLPQVPGGPPDWLLHGVEYGFLALTCAWGTTAEFSSSMRTRCRLGAALALAVAYGALDELHQGLVPTRDPSIRDWLADVTGAAVAVVGLWLWWWRDGRHDGGPGPPRPGRDTQP